MKDKTIKGKGEKGKKKKVEEKVGNRGMEKEEKEGSR